MEQDFLCENVRKPYTVPALIVSALPINQARHILKDLLGFSPYELKLVCKLCQEDEHMTGNVEKLINTLLGIRY